MRRPAKPGGHAQPVTVRSFADDTVYGTCENPLCSRHARATCATCAGEYCLWHDRHPEHETSTESR